MTDDRLHLAQANIGRMVAPLDDPAMAAFVDQLEYINSVADRSPGFVWRLQTEEGDATAVRAFEDDRILFNMSVWEDLESLYEYTYRSDHLGPLRDRRTWFERLERAHLVLWWVPAGHRPTVAEAKARFDRLDRDGPGPKAFTFKRAYTPDGQPIEGRSRPDWTSCGFPTP
jgi:hypothetical protein